MTLSKSTDTPKAKPVTAPTAPPAYKPTAERAAEFVELCRQGDDLIIARIKHVRAELASGATVGGLASTYSIALTKAGLFVPKTLQPSISQASTASTRAALVQLTTKRPSDVELDSVILSASQLVNVLKKNVEPFLSGFSGSAAEFKMQVKALIKRDAAERGKGKKNSTTAPAVTVDGDGEPTPTVTAEKNLPEVISPLEDARKLLKQYRAILDLLVDNSPEDYSTAVDMVLEFSSEYEFEDAA